MNGRGGVGPSTHNAPIFPAREVNLPWMEKSFFGVGNNGLLMLVCSNVRITQEFSIFGITFDAAIWGSLEA